jgi:hypothetical protein
MIEVLLLACILSATACSKATTSAKLRDPSKVSLSFRRLGQSSLRPIHEGTGDFSADLRGFGADESGSLRKDNGTIVLECATCLDGNLQLLSDKGATASADMSVEEVIESRKTSRRKMKLGYEYEVSSDVSLFPELETSWSNVEYYDQTNEPVRWLGWALVPGGFLTIAGALVMILEDPGAGLALLIPGVALDTFGVIQLVKSPTTERFGPDGQLRQAPPSMLEKEPEEETMDSEPEAKPEPKDDLAEEEVEEEKSEEPAEQPEEKEVEQEKEEEPAPVNKVEKKEKKPKKTKKGKKEEKLDDFLL